MLPKLVLASSSPQRLNILTQIGLEPIVIPPDIDETQQRDEDSTNFVGRLAREKVEAISPQADNAVIIGADSIVDLDGFVLGKADDAEHALQMLTSLAGRSHIVFTGIAVGFEEKVLTNVIRTVVTLRDISQRELEDYVDYGEWKGKAGACCVQGRGAMFVERFEGSYHNVVGLPIHAVDELCAKHGWPLSSWLSE